MMQSNDGKRIACDGLPVVTVPDLDAIERDIKASRITDVHNLASIFIGNILLDQEGVDEQDREKRKKVNESIIEYLIKIKDEAKEDCESKLKALEALVDCYFFSLKWLDCRNASCDCLALVENPRMNFYHQNIKDLDVEEINRMVNIKIEGYSRLKFILNVCFINKDDIKEEQMKEAGEDIEKVFKARKKGKIRIQDYEFLVACAFWHFKKKDFLSADKFLEEATLKKGHKMLRFFLKNIIFSNLVDGIAFDLDLKSKERRLKEEEERDKRQKEISKKNAERKKEANRVRQHKSEEKGKKLFDDLSEKTRDLCDKVVTLKKFFEGRRIVFGKDLQSIDSELKKYSKWLGEKTSLGEKTGKEKKKDLKRIEKALSLLMSECENKFCHDFNSHGKITFPEKKKIVVEKKIEEKKPEKKDVSLSCVSDGGILKISGEFAANEENKKVNVLEKELSHYQKNKHLNESEEVKKNNREDEGKKDEKKNYDGSFGTVFFDADFWEVDGKKINKEKIFENDFKKNFDFFPQDVLVVLSFFRKIKEKFPQVKIRFHGSFAANMYIHFQKKCGTSRKKLFLPSDIDVQFLVNSENEKLAVESHVKEMGFTAYENMSSVYSNSRAVKKVFSLACDITIVSIASFKEQPFFGFVLFQYELLQDGSLFPLYYLFNNNLFNPVKSFFDGKIAISSFIAIAQENAKNLLQVLRKSFRFGWDLPQELRAFILKEGETICKNMYPGEFISELTKNFMQGYGVDFLQDKKCAFLFLNIASVIFPGLKIFLSQDLQKENQELWQFFLQNVEQSDHMAQEKRSVAFLIALFLYFEFKGGQKKCDSFPKSSEEVATILRQRFCEKFKRRSFPESLEENARAKRQSEKIFSFLVKFSFAFHNKGDVNVGSRFSVFQMGKTSLKFQEKSNFYGDFDVQQGEPKLKNVSHL